MLSLLKLRGFLVRVSAVNLCGAQSTYLLLPLGPSTSGIGESRVCLPAADQGESVALKKAEKQGIQAMPKHEDYSISTRL